MRCVLPLTENDFWREINDFGKLFTMRIKLPLFIAFVALASIALSGCALITTTSTQKVVIRTTPEGAVVKINGKEVGLSPIKVRLSREDLYRIDIEKAGFGPAFVLIAPSSEAYSRRFFRWGLDEELGVTKVLAPAEINIELKAPTADKDTEDKYLQFVSQVNQADAMLRSGELDAATHRFLVGQIIALH
jgi:hypothetical protein